MSQNCKLVPAIPLAVETISISDISFLHYRLRNEFYIVQIPNSLKNIFLEEFNYITAIRYDKLFFYLDKK